MSSSFPPAEPATGIGDVCRDDDVTDEVALAELRSDGRDGHDGHHDDLRTAIERSQAAIDRGESYSAEQVLAELDEIG
ncbi:MAG TPA: hypothetical protein VE093_47970 [Polyangiaceae bacterium]|nr:hypothetical protein [Polyangiaceae bacterium]